MSQVFSFKLTKQTSKNLVDTTLILPLTVSGCCSTNVRLLTYLNDNLFSHELKILNYDELWENKKKYLIKFDASIG